MQSKLRGEIKNEKESHVKQALKECLQDPKSEFNRCYNLQIEDTRWQLVPKNLMKDKIEVQPKINTETEKIKKEIDIVYKSHDKFLDYYNDILELVKKYKEFRPELYLVENESISKKIDQINEKLNKEKNLILSDNHVESLKKHHSALTEINKLYQIAIEYNIDEFIRITRKENILYGLNSQLNKNSIVNPAEKADENSTCSFLVFALAELEAKLDRQSIWKKLAEKLFAQMVSQENEKIGERIKQLSDLHHLLSNFDSRLDCKYLSEKKSIQDMVCKLLIDVTPKKHDSSIFSPIFNWLYLDRNIWKKHLQKWIIPSVQIQPK